MDWYRPSSLTELLDLKKKYPDAKLVVGNTEVGRYETLSSVGTVAELLYVMEY